MSARRITRATLAAAAATAAVLTTLAVGQSSSQAAPGAATGDNFVLVGRSAQAKDIDEGRKGPSVGDRYVFSENLFEKGSSKRVGRLAAFCDVTYVERNSKGKAIDSLMQCIATFRLPNGQISGQTATRWSDKGATLAITGGSGDYDDATGEIDIKFVTDAKSIYTFQVGDTRGGSFLP